MATPTAMGMAQAMKARRRFGALAAGAGGVAVTGVSTRVWLIGLENGQRIQGRAGATFDGKRREGEHELVALQAARGFHGALEVEIFHDADAHPVEHGLVYGIHGNALRFAPSGTRIPVNIEVVTEEGHLAFLD